MRHAKSDWTFDEVSDFDRPLNSRGLKAAPFMGAKMKEIGIKPDLIISSSANRAKTTAELFAKENNYENDIIFTDDFYDASHLEIIDFIKNTKNQVNTLMIVGHNPTCEKVVAFLSENINFIEVTTANVIILKAEFDSWSDIKEKSMKLEKIFRPKELM